MLTGLFCFLRWDVSIIFCYTTCYVFIFNQRIRMIRGVTVLLLFSFSSYAADDFKPTAVPDHLQVLEQCLLTTQNVQHVQRENNFSEYPALYALFSVWYQKNSANHKRICIDGSEIRRAFQCFLNSK